MRLPKITDEMRRHYETVKWCHNMFAARIEAERYLDWNERYKAFPEIREQIEYAEIVDLFERFEDASVAERTTWEKACEAYFAAHKDIFGI